MFKILFVDDERPIVDIFKKTYSKYFDITGTHDPHRALSLLLENNYNVIVSDQRMPGKSGIEILKEALAIQPDCQRILVTAYTDYDVLVQAINNCQLFQFVNKPWNQEAFRLTLQNACEKSQAALKNNSLIKRMIELNKELEIRNKELEKYLTISPQVHKSHLDDTVNQIDRALTQQKHLIPERYSSYDDKEIISLALQINKKNNLLKHIREQLSGLVLQQPLTRRIEKLIDAINHDLSSNSVWSQIEFVLKKTNHGFYRRIKQKHPSLTEYDLRLASLIAAKISTKDIAFILNISHESANTSKYRLRKKLGLSKGVSISDYLDSLY
jgi:FixJ family two-component response regulator